MFHSRRFAGKYCAYRKGRSWRNRQRIPVVARTIEALRRGIEVLLMTNEPQGSTKPR